MPQMSPLSWSLFLISFSLILLACMVILFFYRLAILSQPQPENQPLHSGSTLTWKW